MEKLTDKTLIDVCAAYELSILASDGLIWMPMPPIYPVCPLPEWTHG